MEVFFYYLYYAAIVVFSLYIIGVTRKILALPKGLRMVVLESSAGTIFLDVFLWVSTILIARELGGVGSTLTLF